MAFKRSAVRSRLSPPLFRPETVWFWVFSFAISNFFIVFCIRVCTTVYHKLYYNKQCAALNKNYGDEINTLYASYYDTIGSGKEMLTPRSSRNSIAPESRKLLTKRSHGRIMRMLRTTALTIPSSLHPLRWTLIRKKELLTP